MLKTMLLKADDYPYHESKAYEIKSGDVFYIKDTTPVTVGEKYKDYPAIVSQICYEPRKWWQFWKKKIQIGYSVEWL